MNINNEQLEAVCRSIVRDAVYDLERGTVTVSPEQYEQLCDVLGISCIPLELTKEGT
jgi:hypothetical protein